MSDDEKPFPWEHHFVALVDAWASGDPQRVYSRAIQTAASLARRGDENASKQIRNIADRSKTSLSHLPKYSGAKAYCAKCESARVTIKYVRENGTEFLERECGQCGCVWYERCADQS